MWLYSLQNSSPSPQPGEEMKQAAALLLTVEKAMIYKCKILGFQDTLFDKEGVHLFYQSYIQGMIAFISGSTKYLYKIIENLLSIGICIWVIDKW